MKKIVEYELVLRQNDQPGCGTFDTHTSIQRPCALQRSSVSTPPAITQFWTTWANSITPLSISISGVYGNSPGEISEGELSAAALRIGMFVGEGADTFDVMNSALLEAARAGGFVRRIGEIDVECLIREWLHRGVEANGLLLYRLRRDAFSS